MPRLLALLILLTATLLPGLTRAEDMRVLLVLSDKTPPYRLFAQALGDALPGSIRLFVQEQAGKEIGNEPVDLVVAAGSKAMEAALAHSGVPVLGVMLHKRSYEALLGNSAQRRAGPTSAIYLNQPWKRQLDFIQAALPRRSRIGVLHSPDTRLELAGLKESCAAHGLTLATQSPGSSEFLFASMSELLDKVDVLLAIPDNEIYNSSSIRNILLTSYRYRRPLIGISPSYVSAGALGAVFSTPEQLAGQTVAALTHFDRTGKLPEPQYPALYSIALNYQVARSLGIDLPSQEEIRERMNKDTKEGMR